MNVKLVCPTVSKVVTTPWDPSLADVNLDSPSMLMDGPAMVRQSIQRDFRDIGIHSHFIPAFSPIS